MAEHAPAPLSDDVEQFPLGRAETGVRFKLGEEFANRQERLMRHVDGTKNTMSTKRFRRSTLQAGQIIKMERMLVRVDLASTQFPEEFDENEGMKTEVRTLERWREFMVVVRKSKAENEEDFRLQLYKTRVIPEIDDENATKKPTREVRLDRKTARVNLYSSLDKSVVVWHPYHTGTRTIIMRPRSNAHSVEWYTFLRESLGWRRPVTLDVDVPDLNVTLKLQRPFEDLEPAGLEDVDVGSAIAKAVAAEQAVAGKIVSQCLDMLKGDPEWSGVLEQWSETSQIGLAWKRYDRLEWIHGENEQKMYGSMAMQQSHDLELRPKQHYPTTTFGKKGVMHEEPAPVEGFLIRLTSQKGTHQRMGKAYFKRLYFSTQNQFLVFNRPAKATPPHPPRLATINSKNVPSAHEIVEASPTMFEIDPFVLSGEESKSISWLESGNRDNVNRHDREALEEARRNLANLAACDGYIDLCRVHKVRQIQWGAHPVDENLSSGSDVDFHQSVSDTRQEDGTIKSIDDGRVFELLLDNGLIVRLQAYDKKTRDEWISRLRKLVKYWKLRTTADMDLFKSVRQTNLSALNIDEEMEALIGQFARKWEVRRSEASLQIYHMCGIGACRSISLSGLLYRKAKRRGTFQRCGVILTDGHLLIFQAGLRGYTGAQLKHVHQKKTDTIDLKESYVYSGLITEDDLLYRNRTFDSNHPGMQALPRVYLNDGWTSTDEDAMTCFVVWRNVRRGWFRAVEAVQGGGESSSQQAGPPVSTPTTGDLTTNISNTSTTPTATSTPAPASAVNPSSPPQTRSRLRRVTQLGVPGRGTVFKCRSRAERDQWVLALATELERIVEEERRVEVRVDR